MISNLEKIGQEYKTYTEMISTIKLVETKLYVHRQKTTYLETRAADEQRLYKEAEDVYKKVVEKYKNVLKQAKETLQVAKSLSGGFTPEDDGFKPHRKSYDELPDNLEVLETEKEQLQTKIDCLESADDGEMREYHRRMELINSLENDSSSVECQIKDMCETMKVQREEYLEPLNRLVAEINTRFGDAFEAMKCAGEVALHTGNVDRVIVWSYRHQFLTTFLKQQFFDAYSL